MPTSSQGPTSGTPSSDETLAQLVKELNQAILALRTLIDRDYPNRREIEAQFVRKDAWDARLRIVLVIILVSCLLSLGVTMGTLSTCYQGAERPAVCNAIPGFRENEQRRLDLNRRIDKVDKIEDDLKDLEGDLRQLERQR